jgi:predicted amidohydrolase
MRIAAPSMPTVRGESDLRLAAYQMIARTGEVWVNLALIGKAAEAARERGAQMLVAPELAVTGYGAGDAIRDLAETVDGPQVAVLASIAAEKGLTVVAGFAEKAGDAIYNSAALIDPSGRRLVYRKCHLYGDYERALFTPGDAPSRIVNWGNTVVVMLICYDVEFPEAARRLAADGAGLAVVPTALPQSDHAAFIAENMVAVRAFENQMAIVYANHAGEDRRFAYAGRSGIVMPDGSTAARASPSEPVVIVADYDPDLFADLSRVNPYLADRRTDLF